MEIGSAIKELISKEKLTKDEFARRVGVSVPTVEAWESDTALPDLGEAASIAKAFGISLDALMRGEVRAKESGEIKPKYEELHDWEFYASALPIEYRQSVEEGLDIGEYEEIFSSVAKLPKGEIKKKFGDVLFDVVRTAKRREDYRYDEPSDLAGIRALRKRNVSVSAVDASLLYEKIFGAWTGRICGCMLGKSIECIRTNELIPFLKESGNYPMHRYIYRSDLTDEVLKKYTFCFSERQYADEIDAMPVDDDTNYVVLAQEILREYGREFTPQDVAKAWVKYQGKEAYCTAERVAYCNFIKGYLPPDSALFQNPYREWIGAQIRGDYYGYINPGDPGLAAEMAFRDASISHVKNGIYGEMFIAAMLAVAATTSDAETILLGGLSEIPSTSRLYEGVMSVVEGFRAGVSRQACFEKIHGTYDEYSDHGWTHTVPNAMIVAAALLYGGGDFGRSICMAVETGFDTDCNGATVGSILGMANGIHSIPEYWKKPINDTLRTSILGVGTVKISERARQTLEHIAKKA